MLPYTRIQRRSDAREAVSEAQGMRARGASLGTNKCLAVSQYFNARVAPGASTGAVY
nr:MAG TPA: hypothetical protein [Caudoviricetes sp.]